MSNRSYGFKNFIILSTIGISVGFFSINLLSPLFAEPTSMGSIEWKPIPYASSYQIQIKNAKGQRIVDKQTEKNSYPIQDLSPGKYQVRVGLVTPFGSTIVWSKWNPIEIRDSGSNPTETNPADRVASVDSSKDKEPTEVKSNANPPIDSQSKISEGSVVTIDSKSQESIAKSTTEDKSNSSGSDKSSTIVNCNYSQIPKEVIKECRDDYIVLDLGTKEKRSIYSVYVLNSNNRSARIQIARFYQDQCKLADDRILSKFNELLESSNPRYNPQERSEFRKALDSVQGCR